MVLLAGRESTAHQPRARAFGKFHELLGARILLCLTGASVCSPGAVVLAGFCYAVTLLRAAIIGGKGRGSADEQAADRGCQQLGLRGHVITPAQKDVGKHSHGATRDRLERGGATGMPKNKK